MRIENNGMEIPRSAIYGVIGVVVVIIIAVVGMQMVETVESGHVKVATMFGKVQDKTYGEGMHVVNPLYDFVAFNVRSKSHKESASVPSQDQLAAKVDVSVQYRIDKEKAARILRNTGTASDMVNVHMIPKLRSELREVGKTIERVEQWFADDVQENVQRQLEQGIRDYCEPKGMIIEAVFLRDVRLPAKIEQAIERKKEREQETEKQKAELERFKIEQQQKVEEAEARRAAAEKEAEQIKVMAAARAEEMKALAAARAEEIRRISEVLTENPGYIQLQALKTLEAMSRNPASQIYFINGDSEQPMPLMHMGQPNKRMQGNR